MNWRVELTARARSDIIRLYAFLLERELEREGGDLELAARAKEAIAAGLEQLARAPLACRRVEDDPHARECIIPFGRSGYVALFDLVDGHEVRILAIRHQREDSYG